MSKSERASEYNKKYYEKNKERIKERQKSYYLSNKDSVLAYQEKYRQDNPEKLTKVQQTYYEKNSEKKKTAVKKYTTENKEKIRDRELKSKFDISLEDYEQLLKEQNNCCAICEKNQETFSKALAVDHCHTTGKVRGLLCHLCNTALGLFKDDTLLLSKAVVYLEIHGHHQLEGE